MNTTESATLDLYPRQAREVRVIKPLQLDHHTPQTSGMRRLAAIWNIVRSGAEAVLVNLTKLPNGEYVADRIDNSEHSHSIKENDHV